MAETISALETARDGLVNVPAPRALDPIELVGKLLALVTLLLPIGGFVERWIAYQIPFGATYWAIPMAWSAPLPQLALTGLLSLLFLLPTVALFASIAMTEGLLHRLTDRYKVRLDRYTNRGLITLLVGFFIFSVLYLLFFAFYVALAADWPLTGFAVVIAVVSIVGSRITWRNKARRRFRDIWWVVVLAVILSNAATGITGTVNGKVVATYEFDPAKISRLVNGQYQELGEDGAFVYLQKCGSNDLYRVNQGEILAVQANTRPDLHVPGPSLVDVLLGATPAMGAQLC